MEPEINSIVEKTTKFKRKLGDLVTRYEYPKDPKSQIILAYHSIISEHHSAIFLLIQNELHGSAFALVRSLYEPLYRAHWVVGCASDKQVAELLEDKNIFPKMYDMVKEIDAAFGIGNFFQNIKKNSWGPMNDYTHSGVRQIGRRFKDNEVAPNYETAEIVEVLNGINIALMLIALLFFKAFGKNEAATEVEKMLAEYTAKHK
ncbi:MAG: hypothetical protein Q8N82_00150 [Deltaproteobacteria bacterium]|nr:hypothetical protein [Deltaproteobacteria bacterium]